MKRTVTGEERVVGPGFRERVYAATKKVPLGFVTTYGDVGGALGSRRVARQVGFALAALDAARAREVPWQRVINAQGRISFKGDLARAEVQRRLLEKEGLSFDDTGKVKDFEDHRHKFDAPGAARTTTKNAKTTKATKKKNKTKSKTNNKTKTR
jgi:methylated-DNA-protein-cysteine methyltransferase-like protein